MNPPNIPFPSDGSRLVDRLVLDATKQKEAATSYYPRQIDGGKRAEAARKEFLRTLADGDAEAFVIALRADEALTAVIAALDEVGGPTGVYNEALRTHPMHDALGAGFRERVAALDQIIPKYRKALATRLAELAEAGVSGVAEQHGDTEVAQLRAGLDAAEAARRDAENKRTYCQRWQPEQRDQYAFSELHGALVAPLPVAPNP